MTKSSSGTAKRFIPLVVLVAIGITIFALDLDEYLTFEALKENHALLTDTVARLGLAAILVYMLIYAVATAVSLPGGLVLTIVGGLLFGTWIGTIAVVIGATIGATAIFLIAKTAFGDTLRARAGPAIQKMEAGFQENAFNYLLVLRLIPLFPFWLVNLVPALLGVRLGTYMAATFIGIIPGTFVIALTGAGLGSVLENNEEFSAEGIFTPEILAALVGLAVLAILPVAYKKIKARKDGAGS
ncbi:MAG: TVP38/TMEM64 family protein [Pseudomonadota bacterium]